MYSPSKPMKSFMIFILFNGNILDLIETPLIMNTEILTFYSRK